MDRERWARLQELFEATRELTAEERRAFLEDACPTDTGIRQAVESLIVHERSDGNTIERIVSGAVVASTPSPPEVIGPYRLLQRIGEGGMGEVYEASQEHPVRRRVALKLIKAGMDTRQVVARFESERQALALMNHSNIAQVFDAGSTEQGRPYFAMEYVRGVSIVDYCDTQRVSNRERIRLFMQVCDGVQHAHQKGIIHRDIKPSNVIVTIEGNKALPKIIDFGVAKAIDRRLTERTMHTELGMMIGTPEYMSPEQAEMTGLDIDTRTDVYALGVLLYELLTGVRPFEAAESPSSLDEIRRRIREEEPSRPSTRVTGQRKDRDEAARARNTDIGGLQRELRGDLDWIVLKALEKDRTRRYGSPSELAADLERHLNNEPVLAGPPSARYRTAKFVRRHRGGVVAAATIVFLVLAFGVTMAWQAARLARERDAVKLERATAEQVSDFMVGLFRVSNPQEALGRDITAREILDKGADRVRTDLAGQPVLQARLMRQMGEVYQDLGLFDRSRELFEEAVELSRAAFGPNHHQVALAKLQLGTLENSTSRYDRAERMLRETQALLETLPDDEETRRLRADAIHALANTMIGKAELDEAEALFRQVLPMFAARVPPDPVATATAHDGLGIVLHTKGDFDAAEKELSAALAVGREHLDPDHPLITGVTVDLAEVLHDRKDYAAAERLYRQALESGERVLGADHPNLADTLVSLGRLLRTRKDFVGAEECLRRTLAIDRRAYGDEHENVAYDLKELGGLLREQGKLAEAEAVYRQSLAMYRRVVDPSNPHLAVALRGLARVLVDEDRFAEAVPLFIEGRSVLAEALPEDHWLRALMDNDLGAGLAELGRFPEAEPLLLESYTKLEARFDSDDPNRVRAVIRLARLYERWGKTEEAQAWRARSQVSRGPEGDPEGS